MTTVANESVVVACAGRTDTGVHGTNQIIHFDTWAERQSRNWLLGTNANLPYGIRLHWVEEMPSQFHARFSATARTYRYVITNQPQRSALFQGYGDHRDLHPSPTRRSSDLIRFLLNLQLLIYLQPLLN